MVQMHSEGYYVLCYDQEMKLADEIVPFHTVTEAFRRMDIEVRERVIKWRHVEVAERTIIKQIQL
jgi:hypothetical protein